MNAMQSRRDHSHPSAGHSHGHYAASGSGSASNHPYRDRDADRRRHYDADRSRSRPPPSSSTSSNRWGSPGRKSYPPTAYGGQRENNCRGTGGRQGGGKVNRQRRHSNDAQHRPRNHCHNRQHQNPRSKKNIVAPDEPAVSSSQQQQQPPSTADETVAKLDPNDKTHARRIRQRRRQVLFGKNTAGYEEYVKKVPRHERRPRSLECPSTPDHTLHIPAKRWQGLMNAWRRSLHKYDPPDLHLRQPAQDTITLAPRPCDTEADRVEEEIAQAKASGLQVAFGSMNVGKAAGLFSIGVADEEVANGPSSGVAGGAEGAHFEEEAAYRLTMEAGVDGVAERADGRFLEESDSDSDDDVL